MDMITPEELVEKLGRGSQKRAADRLGCSRQAVHIWLKTGRVSELYQYKARDILAAEGHQTKRKARRATNGARTGR